MPEKNLIDYEFSNKIGVPASLREAFEHDAESFECFKKNSDEIALNDFLNKLIAGYFEQYDQELFQQEAKYRSILEGHIRKQSELEDVISQIMKKSQPESNEHRKAEKTVHITRTKQYKEYLLRIKNRLQGDNLSSYLRNMFLSYSQKPSYEREKIIFHKQTQDIEDAIKNKNSITVFRRDKSNKSCQMIPYKLVPGRDGQFNYLIGQDEDSRAVSYRLSRIESIDTKTGKKTIDEAVRKYLDLMIEFGSQFSINEDVDTRVLFTEEGRKDFRRIYQGRPKVKKKDPPDENGSAIYHFKCSLDQLYFYFRRFNPGEATILEPESLKKKLRDFHQEHLDALNKQ